MKRCRFGAGLLLALLALGLVTARWMKRENQELADLVWSAWEAARDGEAERAGERIAELERRWDLRRTWTSVLAEHQPLEEIGGLIGQLKGLEDREFYLENCLRLAFLLENLAKSQELTVENLL